MAPKRRLAKWKGSGKNFVSLVGSYAYFLGNRHGRTRFYQGGLDGCDCSNNHSRSFGTEVIFLNNKGLGIKVVSILV
jgi:hypothetical protein